MTTHGTSPLSGTGTGAGNTEKAKTDGLANQEAFLQLLVAQIQNQNPLNPADGVEFLNQLTQFSSLEQMIQVNTQLGEIKTAIGSEAGEGS